MGVEEVRPVRVWWQAVKGVGQPATDKGPLPLTPHRRLLLPPAPAIVTQL